MSKGVGNCGSDRGASDADGVSRAEFIAMEVGLTHGFDFGQIHSWLDRPKPPEVAVVAPSPELAQLPVVATASVGKLQERRPKSNRRRAYQLGMPLLIAVAFIAGQLVGPSLGQAADVGTVTVSYVPASTSYTISPSSLTGAAGDTFTLTQTMKDNAASYVSLVNGTGSVSLGGTSCTATTSCRVFDNMALGSSSSGSFTITGTGTVTVNRFLNGAGSNTTIGTITISAGSAGSSGSTDPALVYPTAYLNANGGTCTGTMQFTKYNGQNGTISLPTGTACTRTDYTLYGWARSASATFPTREFTPGITIPIGDESFTLYAVWRSDGLLVTYDANVGMDVGCLKDGVNQTTAAERRTTRPWTRTSTDHGVYMDASENVRWSDMAPRPVCSPADVTFVGWSTRRTGPVRDGGREGDLVTGFPDYPNANPPRGSLLTLYAQWEEPKYSVQIAPASTSIATLASTTVTVTALRNGVSVPGATVEVAVTGTAALSNGQASSRLTTQASGQVEAVLAAGSTPGQATVTAAYGNQAASVTIDVSAPAATKAISITGSRGEGGDPNLVYVDGVTTGFANGQKVVPWLRFPGQSSYAQKSARPEITRGEFAWNRKTGKKIWVYFTSEDGTVRSNTVIIPAR